VPKCPHADLFKKRCRDWLSRQEVPDDERAAITRHVREIDRLADDVADLDGDITKDTVDDADAQRLLTIAGVNAGVVAGITSPPQYRL
jgi:transposase